MTAKPRKNQNEKTLEENHLKKGRAFKRKVGERTHNKHRGSSLCGGHCTVATGAENGLKGRRLGHKRAFPLVHSASNPPKTIPIILQIQCRQMSLHAQHAHTVTAMQHAQYGCDHSRDLEEKPRQEKSGNELAILLLH